MLSLMLGYLLDFGAEGWIMVGSEVRKIVSIIPLCFSTFPNLFFY